MISVKTTAHDDYDVRVVVSVTGSDDAYRLMWLLLNGQVEFSRHAQGRQGFAAIRKALGAKWFDDLDGRMTNGKAAYYAKDPIGDES